MAMEDESKRSTIGIGHWAGASFEMLQDVCFLEVPLRQSNGSWEASRLPSLLVAGRWNKEETETLHHWLTSLTSW
jgi:hypothetical protein